MERYYTHFAVAAARGNLIRQGKQQLLPAQLLNLPLSQLTAEQCQQILDVAHQNGVKLHHFKRTNRLLPRVTKVLGFLKGIGVQSLVDVGSGRGVFLLPFIDEFPCVSVTSLDILDKRVDMLQDMVNGGVPNLSVVKADISTTSLDSASADVVTLLEVLEHIPNVQQAVCNAVNIAKHYVVVTVPSKEDDNPEHIHLLTKDRLIELFAVAGVHNISFDGVMGHLVAIAKKG